VQSGRESTIGRAFGFLYQKFSWTWERGKLWKKAVLGQVSKDQALERSMRKMYRELYWFGKRWRERKFNKNRKFQPQLGKPYSEINSKAMTFLN